MTLNGVDGWISAIWCSISIIVMIQLINDNNIDIEQTLGRFGNSILIVRSHVPIDFGQLCQCSLVRCLLNVSHFPSRPIHTRKGTLAWYCLTSIGVHPIIANYRTLHTGPSLVQCSPVRLLLCLHWNCIGCAMDGWMIVCLKQLSCVCANSQWKWWCKCKLVAWKV